MTIPPTFTVTELNQRVSIYLQREFSEVWVKAEVSNLRQHYGNLYFTLKDAKAQIGGVWLQRDQQNRKYNSACDPFSGELCEGISPLAPASLRDGMAVECAGFVKIFEPRGDYQLQVLQVRAAGQGNLAQLFEERKRRLYGLGYFAQERKRPLPPAPKRVALVTSAQAAALQDFKRVSSDRGSGALVRLHHSLVQGTTAAPAMARIIREINETGWAQVIVLIRGGGSLEDLWAFNEEVLAKAVFESRIPVLTGIGHDIDTTLADMTADVHAATPSQAAEILWRPRADLWQTLDLVTERLQRIALRRLDTFGARLDQMVKTLGLLSPSRAHLHRERLLASSTDALHRNARHWLDAKAAHLEDLRRRVADAIGPRRFDGLEERRVMLQGRIGQAWMRMVSTREREVAALSQRIPLLWGRMFAGKEQRLEERTRLLAAHDPCKPMERGYVLAYGEDGTLLRRAAQTAPGRGVDIRFTDGGVHAVVDRVDRADAVEKEAQGGGS
ncbi:MAG: exodeoxyribonuclease VII large subunit [Desulfovibrio sp.]|jgi:exodeoxyribonuclease VII large subunit|nr:exodeoxyribonuclease VII large subunit [Desulfovibrio sp.]